MLLTTGVRISDILKDHNSKTADFLCSHIEFVELKKHLEEIGEEFVTESLLKRAFQKIYDEKPLPNLLYNISKASPSEIYSSITCYRNLESDYDDMYIIQTLAEEEDDVRFSANQTEVAFLCISSSDTYVFETFKFLKTNKVWRYRTEIVYIELHQFYF